MSDCSTYEEAIDILKAMFLKPVNEVFARHLLATRRQQSGESLDEFLSVLKVLSRDCNYTAVTATKYRDESIRDAFITGIQSPLIRQRLLENKQLELAAMFDQARALDAAQRNSNSYGINNTPMLQVQSACIDVPDNKGTHDESPESATSSAATVGKCFFCGMTRHPRPRCPAREAVCLKCHKKGHFAKVCRSTSVGSTSACAASGGRVTLASVTSAVIPSGLAKAVVKIYLNGAPVNALIDSGSTESFINPGIVKLHSLKVLKNKSTVSMASSSLSTKTLGCCEVTITVNNKTYKDFRLTVLPELCMDVILGLDFQQLHESVILKYGGNLPPLSICGLATLDIAPPRLFRNLTSDCHPIAARSRRYSFDDRRFIENETRRLLSEGIIEPSLSPWRAQVVVTKDETHKKRLAIDYSETINKFTLLDGYPLPRIDDTVNKIAQYRVFSTIDLKSAYHQSLSIYESPIWGNKWSSMLSEDHEHLHRGGRAERDICLLR
ncbi:hypothetical protein SNEBB_002033 [Seison nebaliae]|nr:hypothetical protein SNEBB_002033 [Seison nebaliae]